MEPGDWTTTELFDYCTSNYLISSDDIFEDWMHDRTDLLVIVKNDIENK